MGMKWKLEMEMEIWAKNAPIGVLVQCFLHGFMSSVLIILLSDGYTTGFMSHGFVTN